MFKKLLIVFVAISCCYARLHAQNVFSATDTIINYNSAAVLGSLTNPNTPVTGVITKWVKTTRVSWNTSNFKSYCYDNMSFRLRFPNNYNPNNATKYPVMVFFHGGGEIGTIYDNEDQLYWGAQLFEQRINNGEWNGFMLFPQQTSVGWDDTYFSRINDMLDTLQKYNNTNPDKVFTMGLSSGGYGAVAYANYYPKRVAAVVSSSPSQVRVLSSTIPGFVHIPLWIANGGVDGNPDPYNVQAFYSDFRNAGGNMYQTYYVNDGHNTWTDMWNQKNAAGGLITSTYWNNANKAQPLVFNQQQQFCDTAAIAAKMGVTAGFYAYQWQQNGSTIPGANGNEYTATQPGTYQVRFMRDSSSAWSDWSPNPVVISTKKCSADTVFIEHFTKDNYFNAEPEYTIGNFTCQNGIMTSGTDLFTQDATGVQGSRFLINYTAANSGCTYTAGDRVWNTYSPVTVLPNTKYEYSFYAANQNAVSPAQLAPIINGTPLITGAVSPTGTGNASWKKYTFIWNSGAFTYADLGIINRSVATTGNDFAIDEICLRPVPPLPVPGCTVTTSPATDSTITTNTSASLAWTAAANAVAYDVYLWTGTTAPTTPVATVTTTTYAASGLTGATLYNWYVVPKNSDSVAATGCGNTPSRFTTAKTPVAPSCTPGLTPANGAVLTTNSTASLTWTAAATATSYDVYLWKGTTAPTTATATVTTTAYNATGLVSATAYNWYIVPKNAVGSAVGCSANTISFTTAAGPSVPSCVTNISPVNGSTISTTTTATLTWNAAPTATSYDLYIWTGNTAPSSPSANVTGTSFNGSGGTPGTLYNWYVVPKNAVGAAIGCSSNKTSFTTAAAPVATGTGTGLRGDYYNSNNLSGYIYLSRTDATVNFDWGTGSPYRRIDGNTFSARWTGYVQPQYSQTYTFYTYSDDGVRLWVNGQLLINNWTDHTAIENSATITLVAGVKYSIRMEYYEQTGYAIAKLLWSSASTPKAIIPQKQLYLSNNGRREIADNDRTADATIADNSTDNSLLLKPGIYPNPVVHGQMATLYLNSATGGQASIQLAGIAGNIIRVQQVKLAAGSNTSLVSTAGLAPGLYIINIAGNVDKAATLKLIVQ